MTPPVLSNHDVLVTGGSGFIGQHLVRRLADTNRVRVLSRCTEETSFPSEVTVFAGDIRDQDVVTAAVDDVDVVFQLAADTGPFRSKSEVRRGRAVNVDASLQLFESLRGTDTRVVVASSAAVYGGADESPLTEDVLKEPLSPYGRQKLAVDQHARMYGSVDGLETVVLRYFNVYGPNQQGGYEGLPGTFAAQAREQQRVTVYGDGNQVRDFVHVSDVVDATVRAGRADVDGDAYNVGTGTGIQVGTLAESIATEFDVGLASRSLHHLAPV